METVRAMVPSGIKTELDSVCQQQRRYGHHYGETYAALLVLGLRAFRKTQAIYPNVYTEARNG